MFLFRRINDETMMNKCTGYWLDSFVRTTHLQDNLINSYKNHMDRSDHWHAMYCTNLNSWYLLLIWISSHNTNYFYMDMLCYTGQCGLLTVYRTEIELYTLLMMFKTFSTDEWSSINDWPLCYSNVCSWNSLYPTFANVIHGVLTSDRTFASYDYNKVVKNC
jgi:hypothetical protein